ncbi:MAG: BON domain-containing protein [Burkholderiaceae bacterium]|nr:BON domain-containing protein [Burkholderiaceae bacterium]
MYIFNRAVPALVQKTVFITLLSAGVITQLSGCFPLMAGAMVGTSLAATDRRTLGTQLEDRQIQLKAETTIASSMQGENVNVTVFNRRVLLTGQTPNLELKNKAEQLARSVENVREVINALEVGIASSLVSRSNDALLTSKVKATFVDAKDVFSNAFKVTTERGVVYLMGRVTQAEGDRAADLTSRIAGVSKVVKVLDLMSEAELRQMQREPAPTSNTIDKPQ